MSSGLPNLPETVWVLFDMSNGDYPAKNYVWWYPTREAARAKKREHGLHPKTHARLIGPFSFQLRQPNRLRKPGRKVYGIAQGDAIASAVHAFAIGGRRSKNDTGVKEATPRKSTKRKRCKAKQ